MRAVGGTSHWLRSYQYVAGSVDFAGLVAVENFVSAVGIVDVFEMS